MNNWCCVWFDNLLGRSGEKGIAIVAFRDKDRRMFFLQARPFEKEVEEYLNAHDPLTGRNRWADLRDEKNRKVPFIISMEISLDFCPRCGANLSKIIGKNLTAFDNLASQHVRSWPGL